MNTVVETAEQTRQSFRPREPRVQIDMSYVQAPQRPADEEPLPRDEMPADEPARDAAEAPPQAAVISSGDAHNSEVTSEADDDSEMSVEEMVAELSELRELTSLFDAELDREQIARTQAESARDEALQVAADLDRELSEARKALTAKTPVAAAAPTSRETTSKHAVELEALATALRNEQAVRQGLETELEAEKAKRLAIEAQRSVAQRAVPQNFAATENELAELKQLVDLLKASHQSELEAERAARRSVEAQRALAERQAETAHRELEAARAAATDPSIVAELEAQLAEAGHQREASKTQLAQAKAQLVQLQDEASARAAAEAEVKATRAEIEQLRLQVAKLDEASTSACSLLVAREAEFASTAQQLADIQREMHAARSHEADVASAAQQEAAGQRELAAKLDAELKAEIAARETAERQLADARHEVAKAQAAVGALDALRQEAAAQRALAAQLDSDLKTALEARLAAEEALATARQEPAVTSARFDTQADAAAQAEAATQRALAEQLDNELKAEQNARDEAEAQLADLTRLLAEAEGKLAAERNKFDDASSAALEEVAAQQEIIAQLQAELDDARAVDEEAEEPFDDLPAPVAVVEISPDPAPRREAPPVNSLAFAVDSPVPRTVRSYDSGPTAAPRLDETDPAETQAAPNTAIVMPSTAPTSLMARAQSLLQSSGQKPAGADGEAGRRERRTAAHAPATVWKQGLSQAIQCTIKNRSSGGALLEFSRIRHGDEISEFSVGDEVTLTFTSYRERSSVTCTVARIEGLTCGVKFSGQFHVQMLKPTKPKKPLPGKEQVKEAAKSPLKGAITFATKRGR